MTTYIYGTTLPYNDLADAVGSRRAQEISTALRDNPAQGMSMLQSQYQQPPSTPGPYSFQTRGVGNTAYEFTVPRLSQLAGVKDGPNSQPTRPMPPPSEYTVGIPEWSNSPERYNVPDWWTERGPGAQTIPSLSDVARNIPAVQYPQERNIPAVQFPTTTRTPGLQNVDWDSLDIDGRFSTLAQQIRASIFGRQ